MASHISRAVEIGPMYERILLPLDGSRLAEEALPYVRFLGQHLRLPIQLLRVVEPAPPELGLKFNPAFDSDGATRHIQIVAGSYLNGVQKRLQASGVVSSYTTSTGSPAFSIVEEAAKGPATLIAIATHGHSGMTTGMMGGVTGKVIQTTTKPIFVVPSRDPNGRAPDVSLSTLIVALDGSYLSEQSLPHVAALAKPLGLRVVLLRVVPTSWDYYYFMDHNVVHYGDFSKDAEDQARQYLYKVGKKMRELGLDAVEELVTHGQPADAIVGLARDFPGSVVAMTAHGHSGVGRWVMGSVTDRVVRHTQTPVLVVRATGGSSKVTSV